MRKSCAKVAPSPKVRKAENLWLDNDTYVPPSTNPAEKPVSSKLGKIKNTWAGATKGNKALIGTCVFFLVAALVVLVLFFAGFFDIAEELILFYLATERSFRFICRY